ncbi:hypothetical protein RRG08_017133 [Elysia crispata]|uniref:Uncharacterized protein n=1 Tax=Elysia crispata TaxID=231223 RepID=A0AAE1AB55_9GAST|nr:hypothetical protein RRG08_017133 [Elysia crispata]
MAAQRPRERSGAMRDQPHGLSRSTELDGCPVVPRAFWGYERPATRPFQDWLNKQPDWSRALLCDLFLGRRWLMQMGGAAEKFGISIQYCTSYNRHILQSVVIPSVTQARVSSDYRPGNDQSKIGITTMFVDALNLAPSKDTFWSTGNQPGNPYHQDSRNDASP